MGDQFKVLRSFYVTERTEIAYGIMRVIDIRQDQTLIQLPHSDRRVWTPTWKLNDAWDNHMLQLVVRLATEGERRRRAEAYGDW